MAAFFDFLGGEMVFVPRMTTLLGFAISMRPMPLDHSKELLECRLRHEL
jgi:hypothetical protein